MKYNDPLNPINIGQIEKYIQLRNTNKYYGQIEKYNNPINPINIGQIVNKWEIWNKHK